MTDDNEELLSLRQASAYAKVKSRQAIWQAIRRGEVKAVKCRVENHLEWRMTKKDVDAYRASKYNQDKRKVEGRKLFDIADGRWSVLMAAKALSEALGRAYPSARLYYLLRTGQLRASRHGKSWIIGREALLELYGNEMKLVQENLA